MMRAALARLALAALAATGCSGGEALDGARQPIFGGAPDLEDAAVVAVVNFAGGHCSGSLIAPSLVLTARHCVADTAGKELQVVCGQTAFVPPDSPGAIFVVPRPTITDDPDDFVAVAEIRVPEDLPDELCGTDVVLLRLKAPLADITPLEPRITEPVTAGESYASVGFGVDEALDDQPSGERKRLDGLQVQCAGDACREHEVYGNEWVGSRGACPGDSGGPALDTQGRVIGVVSRGAKLCESPIFGDVASRAPWLQSEMRGAAPAAPPDDGPAQTCSLGRSRAPAASGWCCALAGLLLWRRRKRRLSPLGNPAAVAGVLKLGAWHSAKR
jgi:hypothetical protein